MTTNYKSKIRLFKANIYLISCLFICFSITAYGQPSCDDLMEYVTSESFGITYYSYDSDAIRQVSFYDITDDSYNTHYFAVVQFTSSYKKYLYQVDYSTKLNYSLYYHDSAGKAFWEYIHPYRNVLGYAPDFN